MVAGSLGVVEVEAGDPIAAGAHLTRHGAHVALGWGGNLRGGGKEGDGNINILAGCQGHMEDGC